MIHKFIFCLSLFFLAAGHSFSQSWDWALGYGGSGHDKAWSSATDAAGNVYVYAFVAGSTANPTTIGSYTFTSGGMKVIKHDPNGNVIWIVSVNGPGYVEQGKYMDVDAQGNIFIVGSFYGPSINFGSFTLQNSSNYSYDIFVVKMDNNGNVLWARGGGGQLDESAQSV